MLWLRTSSSSSGRTARTRAQLADAAGMSRSTITARIEVLMRLGLAPYGDGISTGGRPPSLLALNPQSRVAAGVDIGASHTSVALADLAGIVLAESRSNLDISTGPDEVLGWAQAAISRRGAQGAAGDLGHVRVARADDVTCRCGNQGCLEAIAAGPALARALREAGVAAESGEDVVDLVRSGDTTAARVVRQAGRDIGEVVAMLVNVMNPSAVVIGGAMSEAGESLIAGIREVVYNRSLPLATEHLTITTSRAGGRAGVIGAAALAIGHVLSPASIDAASLAVAGD